MIEKTSFGITTTFSINDELTEADRRILTEFGRNAAVSVDIGTFIGGSAEALLCGGGVVYTIDNYRGVDKSSARICSPKAMEYIARDRLSQFGDRVVILIGESTSFAKLFPKESVDFVFIDGAHDFLSAKADIDAWLPALKLNGVIAGHDFDKSLVDRPVREEMIECLSSMDRGPDNRHYGVFRAVVESFSEFETAKDEDSSIWWAKPQWKK